MNESTHAPGFWSTVREALRGSKQELTAIPIGRAVVLLAVPMVLEMSMESLFAIVDIFFVSKLGSDAVATVGLTESLLSPVYALAMGLGAAATAIIARRTGEKDLDAAATAAVHVILAAIVGAALLGVVGTLLSRHLLALMGASPSVVASGSGYTAVILGGGVTIFLLFVVNAVFRGAGDAALAMRALWIANALNIVLGPCLIFGVGPFPRMGVVGAGVATTVSRGVGVVYQLVMLARGRGRLVLARRHFVFRMSLMREILRMAASASLQTLIETASWLGLVRILSTFGSAALAGYTIAMRVAIFAMLPSWGLSMSASTLVGQNLGAGEPERAERSVATIARYNVAFLGSVGLFLAAVPGPIVGIFTSDPEVAPYAAESLRIVALGFLFFGYGMVAVQAFNGAGDTTTPLLVNLASFWLFKIPVAYVLSRIVGMGPRGVFVSIAAAYSLQAIVAGLLFRRGRWKTIQVE
jgi:putative MATE family efflux protein